MKKLFCRGTNTNSSLLPVVTNFRVLLLMLSFSLLAIVSANDAGKWYPGQLDSLGVTVPSGDIVVKEGDPLDILCCLNPTKNNTADDLVYYYGDSPVDSQYVTKVNNTVIRLRINNTVLSHFVYYCYLKKTGILPQNLTPNSLEEASTQSISNNHTLVSMNIVSVGSLPKDVENLSCISEEFSTLYCTWKKPTNYVETTYNISYQRPGRPGIGVEYSCPEETPSKFSFCRWPRYRRNFEFLKITVTGENRFGHNKQQMQFHNYARIKPSTPSKPQLISKTSTSVYFKFEIGELQYLSATLNYRIQFTRNATNWTVRNYTSNDLTRENGFVFVNVTGLQPHVQYNFRVYVKTESAAESFWSEPGTEIFKTMEAIPFWSPKVDVGAFEIESLPPYIDRDVIVYWQQMDPIQYNSDGFGYAAWARPENGNVVGNPIVPVYAAKSHAKFHLNSTSYRVFITAKNNVGLAERVSELRIPESSNQVSLVDTFTKTDYGHGLYQLTWDVADSHKVVNFTVFWCESTKERPVQCDGYIDWEHFTPNIRSHNFSLSSTSAYQFAISANTAHSSSGMKWAECTIVPGRMGVIKNLRVKEARQNYLELDWLLECVSRGHDIEGYNIYYCVANSSDVTRCHDEERSVTVPGTVKVTSARLGKLLPNTLYMISVSIRAKNEVSKSRSEHLLVRTAEGPPKVTGLKVRVLYTNNSCAEIEWERPTITNGNLTDYKVLYGDGGSKVVPAEVTSALLTGLASYTTYNATVRACTTVCSDPMEPVTFSTGVGAPSQVENIEDENNGTHITIRWKVPHIPAGPHPSYEVKVEKTEGPSVTYKTETTEIVLGAGDCEKHRSNLVIKVRALNKDVSTNREYFGSWSVAYNIKCDNDWPTSVKIVLFLVIPFFVIIPVIYCGRIGVHKCKQMKSVRVTIPLKFTHPPPSCQPDTKAHELIETYSTVSPQMKSQDEFSNLVEKTTEFSR